MNSYFGKLKTRLVVESFERGAGEIILSSNCGWTSQEAVGRRGAKTHLWVCCLEQEPGLSGIYAASHPAVEFRDGPQYSLY